ncbi:MULTISPECIES: hypothetical protein [unclassified Lysinibacillus]|uniref:MutS-related protein n=1 Tax=unclassified Lysinibacillus TaxID=2636778 RepID=UPI0035DECF1E
MCRKEKEHLKSISGLKRDEERVDGESSNINCYSCNFSHYISLFNKKSKEAIAINAILAQTTNTVLAKIWTMKPSYLVTSMAIQDSVLEGDSYFIAEIKSLKRIIRLSKEKKPKISFIDEILKGTNTIERISASATIVEWLSVNQGMTIIVAHDIELTEIAGELYSNYHFRETIENGKVLFDYKVHDGPSMTRNAIKLLEVLAYPESVTTQANQLAQHFTEVREWQKISKNLKQSSCGRLRQ